jgi:hypothetical protein
VLGLTLCGKDTVAGVVAEVEISAWRKWVRLNVLDLCLNY